MNTYFTPLLDVTRKWPVWCGLNFTASTDVSNTRCVFVLLGYIVDMTGVCVDLAFFLVWFKFTCAVSTDSGKYLSTSLDVNNFHDLNNSLSMAYLHVDSTGLGAAACRYCFISVSDEVWCTLLLCSSCSGVGHRCELPVIHYHQIMVIYPYPLLVVITQFFYSITFINDCICILTGSSGWYLFMIVYVIQNIRGSNNSPDSLNLMVNYHYHSEKRAITW